MLKPQPPQQTSQPPQPPPTQQAVARRPPGGTSPPNGGLPGPLAVTAAPPGPPVVASPCLGPAAGSGLRRGAEGILAPPPHQERPGAAAIGSARGQSTGKGPPQSPVFEGVYNNSRMLHFLTAVVGSTCDVKVKNGTTYEGIFKTLSSKFELAVDAVHRKASEPAGGPRREDIVDTMVFKPSDVMLVHFRNVDFNYATKDKFTDSAIAMNSKVNGEHKEKKKTTQKSSVSGSCVQPSWLERSSQVPSTAYGLLWKMRTGAQRRRSIVQSKGKGQGERAPAWHPGRGSISLCRREFGKVPGEEFGVAVLEAGGLALAHCHPVVLTTSTTAALAQGLRLVGSMEAQRPLRGGKTLSSPNSRPSGEASVPPPAAVGRMYPPRSPKSAVPAPISTPCPEPPLGSAVATSAASIPVTSVVDPGAGSITPASPKISLTPTDVKEVPAKEPGRTLEPQDLARIAGKVSGLQNEQKRFQLEELRKFGAQFKLQPPSSPETSLDPFSPRILKEEAKGKEKEVDGLLTSESMGSPVSSKTESVSDKEDKPPLASAGGAEGSEQPPPPCPSQTGSPPVGLIKGDDKDEGPVAEQVKKSTLNPNAKEFNPTKPLLSVNKSTSTPTSPGPRTHSTPSIPVLTAGQSGLYSPQYISYIPQIHMGPAVQAPQMYPYPVSNSVPGQQGKYRGAKGSLPPQRSDQHQPASAPPMMQAAAAAGPPLVAATPYSSYIPYNPQQFPGQPAMMQPMAHYPSQPVFAPMLQSNQRMLTSGSHPPAIVSSSTPQYPSAEQPTPQALYATVHQSYPHHATQLHAHQPQPATTPTGSQPQSQHAAPSPVQHQAGQAPHLGSGQPQQNLYHPGALTGTPPSLPPGPSAQSPQSSFPQPAAVYAIHPHQQLPHGFTNMAHVTQAHVQTGVTAAPPPHPGAPHPPQVMLLHPTQGHGGPPQGAVPPSGVPALSASTPSPYPYIGHPQGEQPGQAPGFPGGADDRIREFSLAGGIWHGRAEGLQVGQDARVLGGE
ncbi:ataxin-2-like protein isoform X16 [Perognathus longimembris pacificus]|uniref:ataxin-2-like protein isoform X16 n=1 Tax=Perognathus longimembris pacificus TaxID=214514 RepID=UPI002019D3A3|nr:ataxin-2-like protein isoform X16 [Perognathus longimembris pacificus]